MNMARRLPGPVKIGLSVVLIGVAAWASFAATRRKEPFMPTVTPGVTAPPGATTTTGMSAVGVVSFRLGEGPRTLVVNVAACGAVRNGVDVSEDASRVLLYARTTGGSDAFCSDGTTVSLAQELGQRTVIDGHSGQPVIVEGQ